MRLPLWAALCICSLPVRALQTDVLEVSRDAGVFHVVVNVLIDASPALVQAVLLDTSKLSLLDPGVRATRVRAEGDGQRVEMDIHECLFGFCRQFLQVQQVEVRGNEITARTLPVEGSGFRSGIAHWQLSAEGEGTRLIFTADTEPDLWLPPLIGPRVVMKQLREKTLASLETLERLARE